MSKNLSNESAKIAEPFEARAEAISKFYAHKIEAGKVFEVDGHTARFTLGHWRGVLFEFWPFKRTNSVRAEWCAVRRSHTSHGCAI